jgi:hypothetical protein
LRQLFDRAAQVRVSDALGCRGVSGERVQDERARTREHRFGIAEGEERSDAAPLSPLASDLDGKLNHRLQVLAVAAAHLAADRLEHALVAVRIDASGDL